jgi:hypothetical protein
LSTIWFDKPIKQIKRVVLPEPFGPIISINSPRPRVRSIAENLLQGLITMSHLILHYLKKLTSQLPDCICTIPGATTAVKVLILKWKLLLDGNPIVPEKEYSDRKGEGSYDYPSGTHAFNVQATLHLFGV